MARKRIFIMPAGIAVLTAEKRLTKDAALAFAQNRRTLAGEVTAVEDDLTRAIVTDVARNKEYEIRLNPSTGRWEVYDLNYHKRDHSILYTATQSEQKYLKEIEADLEGKGFNRKQIAEGKAQALEGLREVTDTALEYCVEAAIKTSLQKFYKRHYRKLDEIEIEFTKIPAKSKKKRGIC